MDQTEEILTGWMARFLEGRCAGERGTLRLCVDARRWFFSFGDRAMAYEESALSDVRSADCTVMISDENLRRLGAGELNPQVAFLEGRLRISGEGTVALRMNRFFC